MYFTASPTVTMDSAASSGISMPNSSSNAMTNSTVSRLSAPRSSMKEALSTTLSASTFRWSTTIFFTRSAVSLMGSGTSSLLSFRRLVATSGPRQGPHQFNVCGVGKFCFVTQCFPGRHTRCNVLKLLSDHCHPAIHMQGLAGDIGRFRARQIEDGGADLVRFAESAHRDPGQLGGLLLLGQGVGHGCGAE